MVLTGKNPRSRCYEYQHLLLQANELLDMIIYRDNEDWLNSNLEYHDFRWLYLFAKMVEHPEGPNDQFIDKLKSNIEIAEQIIENGK